MIDFKNDYDEEEVVSTHIVTFGLIQGNWAFDRGSMTTKPHVDEADNKTKVVERVDSRYDSGNKFLVSIDKYLDYYDNEGNKLYEREIKRAPLSRDKLRIINRAIAERRIDYLEDAAVGLRALAQTLPTPYKEQYIAVADSVDFMFDTYKDVISEYKERQTDSFEEAILNETNPQMLAILSIPVRSPDEKFPNGLTVKQSILYQLTGVKP